MLDQVALFDLRAPGVDITARNRERGGVGQFADVKDPPAKGDRPSVMPLMQRVEAVPHSLHHPRVLRSTAALSRPTPSVPGR